MPDVPGKLPADVGSVAPDVSLTTLDDKPFSLSAFKNRVVVLVFGSYSCPSFRQRAPALEKLHKQLGGRAMVVVVYTKEAHAVGEWDTSRNKDDGVQVEQPTTLAARKELAVQARDTLKISVPILLDSIDNRTANDYGLTPNGAVVIARDDTVAIRQVWFEGTSLANQINTLLRPDKTISLSE